MQEYHTIPGDDIDWRYIESNVLESSNKYRLTVNVGIAE
jgi:hypothetical protein